MKKQQDWGDESLHRFLQIYRATPNPSAPDNKSPAELMLGRKMRLPLDAVRPTAEHKDQRNTKMEESFNTRHEARERRFQAKEEVLFRLSTKHGWESAVIVEAIGKVMYNILANGRLLRVHTNQLKRVTVVADDIYEPTASSEEKPAKRPPRINPRLPTRSSPPKLRARTRKDEI